MMCHYYCCCVHRLNSVLKAEKYFWSKWSIFRSPWRLITCLVPRWRPWAPSELCVKLCRRIYQSQWVQIPCEPRDRKTSPCWRTDLTAPLCPSSPHSSAARFQCGGDGTATHSSSGSLVYHLQGGGGCRLALVGDLRVTGKDKWWLAGAFSLEITATQSPPCPMPQLVIYFSQFHFCSGRVTFCFPKRLPTCWELHHDLVSLPWNPVQAFGFSYLACSSVFRH